jgi:uncharacterized protein (DUF1330 family)
MNQPEAIMKIKPKAMLMLLGAVALATGLGAIGLGAIAIEGLHAQVGTQTKPKIYIVNEVEILDPVNFKAHAGEMDPLIEKFGGTFLARRGKAMALNGAPPKAMVIVMFENKEKEQAWENDPRVKELIATRNKYANFRSIVVEGVANE